MLRFDRHVTDIRSFYHNALGRWVARRINQIIRTYWDDTRQRMMLGIGYAIPFFAAWPDSKPIAVMTASQGVMRWPAHGACQTVLTEDHLLPFADESCDYIIVAHELENTDYPASLLQEAWRVLKPQGRMIVIVPNRLGWWARSDKTPFGFGRAFSSRQLRHLLQAHKFVWLQRHYGVYGAPARKRVWISLMPVWEWIGQRFFTRLGGVLIAEVSKQVYNVTPMANVPPSSGQRRVISVGEWTPSPAG
jgi:SAM-dependent methyltransferase